MAHKTHKTTQQGRSQTLARKQARAAKQGTAIDWQRMARDLGATIYV